MRWHYEGKVSLKTLFFIQAAGTVSEDGFEIDQLVSYSENGDERELTQDQDDEICDWLNDKAPDFYQQALESSADDAYDRWKDRD